MLLQLPTELIQLILLHCETPAFFQAARTNRRLYEISRTSREVLLHQLHHTPGFIDHLKARSTAELYFALKSRSNEQLHDAESCTEFTTYGFSKVIDSRASVFEKPRDSNRALLVFKNHSTVYLVKIQNGKLTREAKWESPGQDLGEVEVLQTAFDGDHGVYVLHRFKTFPDQELDLNHPFVKHALQSRPNGSIFLAYHDLNSDKKVRMCAFPEQDDYRPLALSVAGSRFAISWQNAQTPYDHTVVLYQLLDSEDEDESEDENEDESEDEDEHDESADEDSMDQHTEGKKTESCKITYAPYQSHTLVNSHHHPSPEIGPAVKLTFNDRGFQLLYHYRAQTLYGNFQRLHNIPGRGQADPRLIANKANVQFTSNLSLQFSIDIPFFATHDTGHGAEPCHWQYLAFGTATHRVENWTVACLLKSEAFPSNRCTHVMNLERGRRFEDWQVMAQLGGFQQLTTSHGSQVAASRFGERIAVANWKTLYVWALEPHEVLDAESEFYPSSWDSSTGTLVLRPVILHLGAVCSQLEFTENEDELIAITDRGVMYVNLNSKGSGKREEFSGHEIIFGVNKDH